MPNPIILIMYRAEILENSLKELTEKTVGLQGAVIVSSEGFVVAAYPNELSSNPENTTTPQVAAMAATLVALGEQALKRLARGEVERLMVEGHGGAIVVYPINASVALAALLDKNAKVGITLLAVARAAQNLSNVLDDL